ncbi:cyanamide hydratase family HD domain-containing protein [Mariannaea sp. PMI_226]|nr:cyanamide hydratase family HD domain-containing protein [Mariannaea sp. PMI_226]
MSATELNANGWTPVSVDIGQVFNGKPYLNQPEALLVSEIKFPVDDPLVAHIQAYAKARLSLQAYNHSMRVFYFGMTIAKQQFPDIYAGLSPSTWALTCLLHDIGTAEENLAATRMSFDIYGGIVAMKELRSNGSTADQSEAVAEAIIRHQDMGQDGTITFIGQLIQLATLYDNCGKHPYVQDFDKIVTKETRDDVNKAYPRLKWNEWFSSTIKQEMCLKPWCHSTHIPNFDKDIESNTLTSGYE